METLELERMCRLCGKQLHNTIVIHIFNSKEDYKKKIQTLLPIMIHEMDCLPKYLCYDCSSKLNELYNFYMQTLKIDIQLKNELSWMKDKSEEPSDIEPMVYFADLKSLKIKSEIENLEDFYSLEDTMNFNLIQSSDASCSVDESHDSIYKDKLNFLSTTATINDNQQCKNLNDGLPLDVTIPVTRIDNELQNNCNNNVLDSGNNIDDKVKQSCHKENNQKNNLRDKIDDTSCNKNYHSLMTPGELMKSVTNGEKKFLRKLRPRQELINNRSSIKITKKKKRNESMIDKKLSKKVEVKIEKLNCKTVSSNTKNITDINFNNSKDNINYSSNINNIHEKPTVQTENLSLTNEKSLSRQNNLNDIKNYKSKADLCIKDITVKLTKINLEQLNKSNNKRKFGGKISKLKNDKKICETYSCEGCNKLFIKKELYKLHFCYFH